MALEELSTEEIAEAIGRLRSELVVVHPARLEVPLRELAAERSERGKTAGRLLREHDIFASSVAELEGLNERVRLDGHGGNRQALGQYWRILLESIERHLREEVGQTAGMTERAPVGAVTGSAAAAGVGEGR